MITPTVGRIVWFWDYQAPASAEPQAAIVTRVWSDRMVNLCVFRADGTPMPRTSVNLLQDGDPTYFDVGGQANAAHCQWMPYQKGQAAKTEAAEAATKAAA